MKKPQSKEYFSETEYGVKASPRVSEKTSRLKRGGGRYQVGKPYRVKGKWYYPKEVKSYSKLGKASWYGAAFHGRLTANGEIYDMTHLTAAHPTLPLPSYARVTNTANGNSVIVRVNDRGPFAHGRIIDLSKRAAQMLDYTHSGIAKVKVDYIGPAPLHGQDDSYLVASYRPGGKAPDPSDGLPSGVMLALNDTNTNDRPDLPPLAVGSGTALPEAGPILTDRPDTGEVARRDGGTAVTLAYASDSRTGTGAALAAFAGAAMHQHEIVGSWKRREAAKYGELPVFAGTFSDLREANALRERIVAAGRRTEVETSYLGSEKRTSITVWPASGETADDLLQAAWDAGASNAMILRD